MLPRIKWGFITGGIVALLNLCGGIMVGVCNNCFSIITVAIAAAIAGYFCGHQESIEKATKAGAISGLIIGVISLISQLIGGIIGGLSGTGIIDYYNKNISSSHSNIEQNLGAVMSIIIVGAFVMGGLIILESTVIGAVSAKIATNCIQNRLIKTQSSNE
jgi:hypothetical protein